MLAKKHRTYSLRCQHVCPPSASLAATAAASSALSSNANSRCNSLSSQAAAAALRRYSLTQDSLRKVPDFSHYTPAPTTSRRPSSFYAVTARTRSIQRRRGWLIKTVPCRSHAPRSRLLGRSSSQPQKPRTCRPLLPPHIRGQRANDPGKRRLRQSSPIWKSDLNSVMEENTNYSFIQNFSAIHETPRTLVTPEPRPIRSALKPNQSPHARKHSSGSRVSFSSQSSTNPSVSHYANKNTSTKTPAVVDTGAVLQGTRSTPTLLNSFPPVVVDIINHKRVITAPPARVSPPISHGSPNTSPTQLTPQPALAGAHTLRISMFQSISTTGIEQEEEDSDRLLLIRPTLHLLLESRLSARKVRLQLITQSTFLNSNTFQFRLSACAFQEKRHHKEPRWI